jgi:hypothetical protein
VKEHQEVLRTKEFDFNELYELFEENRKAICEWNIESLKQMIESIPKEDEKKLLRLQFESSPEYLRLLVLTVGKYIAENQSQLKEGMMIPLDLLKPCFEELPEKFKKSWYVNFGRLKQVITEVKKFDRLNEFLKYYQLEFVVYQNEFFIKIRDKNTLLNLLETLDIVLQKSPTVPTAPTSLEASETQYNAFPEGSKKSPTVPTEKHISEKLHENESLSGLSGVKTTPSESFINEGIKPNRRVGTVGNVVENSMTISQSQEPTKDKSLEDTSDTIKDKIIKKLKELGRVRVAEIKEYFTNEEAKVMLKLLDDGVLVLDERKEGMFILLNENVEKPQDEIAGRYSRLEEEIIQFIKTNQTMPYDFDVISFFGERYEEDDIKKVLNNLIKNGIIIQRSDGKLELNWTKLMGGG